MAQELPPPSPKTNLTRDGVSNEVALMLLDSRVKWIAVVFERHDGAADRFSVTPWTKDPTGS